MTESPTVPNPGSNEAIDQGCTCPVLSNNHGRGTGFKNKAGETMFWKSGDCPVHCDGLNLDSKSQLAQGRKHDASVKPTDENPHSSDD